MSSTPARSALPNEMYSFKYPHALIGGRIFSVHHELENDLTEIAYRRYGFIAPNSSSPLLHGAPTWTKVQKFLGEYSNKTVHAPQEDVQHHLQNFFHYLIQSDTVGISAIPADYLDLLSSRDDLLKACTRLSIRTDFLDDQKSYILTPLPQDGLKYEIVVSSATIVVEILRSIPIDDDDKLSLKTVVADMQHGLRPFRTCIRASPMFTSFSTPQMWSSGLGYRPKGYQATLIDYQSYRATLEDFLHLPRGRAAMRKGGIVGRLAKDFLTSEDVSSCPSDNVLQSGHWQKSDADPYLGYWDDELSVEELDMICGVYRVDTGQGNGLNGPQTSDISWWPKHSAWVQSGLNIGVWTPDCEHWYQHRLAEIHAESAKLLSPVQWKSAIRFTHQSLKVAQINESLAAEFLDSVI